ncbi:glycine cleavage system protein GcvH [Natrarchaeobius halalkaliphilus]|uniref:Probable glycine cleavage system H protein n=1 Tax=Natrarchaeobius halalkaliphilus TaxID=1679091 RepID=A0A3N6LLY9_9EURY|nr:glycine cleavage system protein GcvH [Natrarchaeobius halalkaliphilus]RQG90073.1 glycine cleavage system protein GcvH [Natrarchaeobius halalkaliphilus]
MEFTIPDELLYEESHEWVDEGDGAVRIGITDFAQDELGDIVFVELPSEGETLERGDEFGLVESIKAVSDVYVPVAGTVTETNDEIIDRPELINEDPFGDGWMIELETTDTVDHLLDADEYSEQI